MASWLRGQGHEAWTAYEAKLEDAPDDALIAYSQDKRAILVTTNRDCVATARRMRSAQVVWLRVLEVDTQAAMARASEWLEVNRLPPGRVLRVSKRAELTVLAPLRPG